MSTDTPQKNSKKGFHVPAVVWRKSGIVVAAVIISYAYIMYALKTRPEVFKTELVGKKGFYTDVEKKHHPTVQIIAKAEMLAVIDSSYRYIFIDSIYQNKPYEIQNAVFRLGNMHPSDTITGTIYFQEEPLKEKYTALPFVLAPHQWILGNTLNFDKNTIRFNRIETSFLHSYLKPSTIELREKVPQKNTIAI